MTMRSLTRTAAILTAIFCFQSCHQELESTPEPSSAQLQPRADQFASAPSTQGPNEALHEETKASFVFADQKEAKPFLNLRTEYLQTFLGMMGFGLSRTWPSNKYPESLTLASGEAKVSAAHLLGIAKQKNKVPAVYVAAVGQGPNKLKHERPFGNEHHLQSQSLRATRALDSWELAALEHLQTPAGKQGPDFALTEFSNSWRYMIAIRAEKHCLKCHESEKRGALLGAFTLELEKPAARAEH